MEFRIEINNPNQSYTPGSLIEGKVVLDSKHDEAARAVRITFSGRSKTRSRRQYEDIRGKEMLFTFTHTLYEGNYTFAAANRLEWPFRFTFPSTAMPTYQEAGWREKHDWPFGPGSPLPPSFMLDEHGLNGIFQCSVQYRLDAELTRPLEGFHNITSRTRRDRRLLRYQPARSIEQPVIQYVTNSSVWHVQSFRILPEYQKRSLTMKERFQSAFSDGKVPLSVFRITARTAAGVIEGGRIPILVKAEHLENESNAPLVPPVMLREVTVSARSLVTTRTLTNVGTWHEGYADTKIPIASHKNLDISLDPGDPVIDLSQFLTIKAPRSLQPDFQCYNIDHRYTLEVKLVVQSADKSHNLRGTVAKFNVLPAIYAGDLAPPPMQPDPEPEPMPEPQKKSPLDKTSSGSVAPCEGEPSGKAAPPAYEP